MTRPPWLAMWLAIVLGSTVACEIPDQCIARGATTTYRGSASYAGQVTGDANASTPLVGSIAATLEVDDFTPDCAYHEMEFVIVVGGCRLRATLGATTYAKGAGFVGANATIVPNQLCDVSLAEGTARVRIEGGQLAVEPGSTVHTEMAGEILQWRGADAALGHLDVRFDGQ